MTKILVADDSQLARYQLQVLLGSDGYQLSFAADGAEALAQARQDPPDLIISDILMPVMDGFTLCREWRRDERLWDIPFVFYTATYTDDQDREFALSLGARRFLSKSEEPDELLRALRQILEELPTAAGNAGQPRTEPLVGPAAQNDVGFLKQYNETLIRKLEAKMQQLEQTNRQLEQEVDKLRKAEQMLQLQAMVLDQIHDHVTVTDLQGRIQYVNDAECRLTKRAREELVGRSVEFYGEAPVIGATQREIIQQTLAHGQWRGEVVNFAADGTRVVLDCRTYVVRDATQEAVSLCGIATDITERKQVEEKMREQLRELQRWHGVTLEREERVLELKKEVNQLLARLGEPPRYLSVADQGAS
jgi:PAS domain S-box-containing protein